MKATFWLPEPLQHLIALFGPTHTLLYASTPLFVPRGNDVLGGGIRQTPRIRIGDVVLSRRTWVVPVQLWPQRRSGEGDEAFWVRVAAWHADNGLPDRYFVRGAMDGSQAWRLDHKTRKPTFVDLAARHLVALLERFFADAAELVVITEALPDLDAAVRYGSDRHVTELVVELPGGCS